MPGFMRGEAATPATGIESKSKKLECNALPPPHADGREMKLPSSYLRQRITAEQALAGDYEDGVPWGEDDDWQRMIAKRLPGDELWVFAPPSRNAFEVWGIALVRDGEIISTVVTAIG